MVPAEKSCGLGDVKDYLALQPISSHQWLKGFGHHCSPKSDEVWICGGENKTPSVMSEEALQEVWPSFLQDERNKKVSNYEGSEDEDVNGDLKDNNIKDENKTSGHDKVENGNDENEVRNTNRKIF